MVIFTVTDACNNSSSTTATFTIVDVTAPTITSASNETVECNGSGNTTQLNDWLANHGGATASDVCSGVTWSNDFTALSDGCGATGSATVTFTATDACNNSSSTTATFTIVDLTAPTITCPASVTVNCQDNTSVAIHGSATATDICSGAAISYTELSSQNSNPQSSGHYNYTITRTWKATDACGNSSTCVQTITVQDITAPMAICKPVTITLVNGTAAITASNVDNGSNDNCSPVSLSVSKTSFNCNNIGNNTVILTVTDVTGNSSSCPAVVTVVGEIPTCTIAAIPTNNTYTGGVPTNIYLGYGPQSVTLQVTALANGAPYTYAWSGGTLSNYNSHNPVFTATTAGNFTFTVVVTNKYGCTTTCTISICVRDIRVPGTSGNNQKVYLCHVPSGNPGNPQTLSISVNAVPAHLTGHVGDRLGSCDMLPCSPPLSSRGTENVEQLKVTEVNELTLKASPNPSSNYFLVSIESKDKAPVTLRVINSVGQFVDTDQNIAPGSIIQIGENYKGGTYYLQAMQGNKRAVVKLVKLN